MPARKKTTRKKRTTKVTMFRDLKHPDESRPNLATEQTADLIEDEVLDPLAYSPPVRGAGSTPRLSWRRREGLEEPETSAHPLYVHEEVNPKDWIGSLQDQQRPILRRSDLPEGAEYQPYRHRDDWRNRIIQGDCVQVMASLARRESLAGQVQMIFYDPPYGISFGSNFQRRTDKRAPDDRLPAEPRSVCPFRDTWKNGIHSYLDAVYETATHARDLLAESGSFFMQIGPKNVAPCEMVLDEVFGSENRVERIAFRKSGGTSSGLLPAGSDYLLWYAKDRTRTRDKYSQLYESLSTKEKVELMSSYAVAELGDGTSRSLTEQERQDPEKHLPSGARIYRRIPLHSQSESTTGRSVPFEWKGRAWPCPPGRQWAVSAKGMDNLARKDRLTAASPSSELRWKQYASEIPGRRINNLWEKMMNASDMHYVVETAETVVERCILMSSKPGDLVMDLTCGSGTSALVAEQWGRRWITTDASAVPIALARQRLATATFDWYYLRDSGEGRDLEESLTSQVGLPPPKIQENGETNDSRWRHDPAKGFVYERVPTVSAAILAYDLDAPPTLLVNRPYVQKGIRRVSGPFTVESISPYRTVAPGEWKRTSTRSEIRSEEAVLNALEASGVRIGDRQMEVTSMEQWSAPDPPIRAIVDIEGLGRTAVAVFGDERTASDAVIHEAARAAARDRSIKHLLVIAFAYEADARGATRQKLGRLEVTRALANRDLMIPDLASKRHAEGIVAIGEPDVELVDVGDGKFVVEVRGWMLFDPVRGEPRYGRKEDIDTWLLDTNHDQKAFVARRIHFPNQKNDCYLKRLKRQIARNLLPDQWDAVFSTTSAPFPKPKKGFIAVRIISTAGVEMTCVRAVADARKKQTPPKTG